MSYDIPDRFPCPFCESRLGRLEYVSCGQSISAVAEISDCERSPGGGAILVWPKRHVELLSQLTDLEARDIANLLHQTSSAITRALEPQAFHTFCSAGSLVGQSEAHMHFQIQPRYCGRHYSFESARDLPTVKMADRKVIAAKVSEHLRLAHSDVDLESLAFGDSYELLGGISATELERLIVTDASRFLALCHPNSRGAESILVVSKSDVPTFLGLERDEREQLILLVRDLARAVEETFDPDGLSVWWETGHDAGQLGRQLAVEIVPRFHKSKYVYQNRIDLAPVNVDNLARVAAKYRKIFNLGQKSVANVDVLAMK